MGLPWRFAKVELVRYRSAFFCKGAYIKNSSFYVGFD